MDKIKEVIAALEGTGLKYQVGFNRRFDHNFEALQKAVADGKVGKPEIIKITSRDPEPPGVDYVKSSGGMFLDMTIHDFDMARFLRDVTLQKCMFRALILWIRLSAKREMWIRSDYTSDGKRRSCRY